MTSFFMRLFAVCAAGILAGLIADTIGGGTVRTVKLVISLCVLATVGSLFITELRTVVSGTYRLPDLPQAQSFSAGTTREAIAEQTVREMEARVAADILAETGIKPLRVVIEYSTDSDEPLLTLHKAVVVLPKGLQLGNAYVRSLANYLGCDVRITYE